MIKCPNCGAELNYDIEKESVTCKHCRTTFNPKELNVDVKTAQEVTFEGTSYLCSQCGAELMTFDETAITFCSYCGSQSMLKSRMVTQNAPEFIIPFKKTQDECIKIYKSKVSKALFAPSYMKKDAVVKKFRGIFIPYEIYKLSYNDRYSTTGKKYSHRSGDYVYYDDYKVSMDIDSDYEGLSYDLVSNYYDRFSNAIPHNFKEKEEFNPNYLAGFYADVADVDKEIYDDNVKVEVSKDAITKINKVNEVRRYNCMPRKIDYSIAERKVGMFPVYFLAMRDKKSEHINYAVVNGQTGKVAIDLPIDFKKYLIGSLIIAIPLFLLLSLSDLFLVLPQALCGFSMFISIVSLVILAVQRSKIHKRENHLDDEGYSSKEKEQKKKGKTFRYIIKPIIAIVISFFALISGLVSDIVYYGSTIIAFLLMIWSFLDIVKSHNTLVSSKLPQLEKRGGDENE